ncbi:MAG: ribosome-associated translation inhibitor RaiA [Legionellales bacterium]|nr:ribosome-associated translation inhibitor RaiA [Legionellales bacterium]
MQINFTGHHVDVTPALREFTEGKFDRLERFADRITSIDVKFEVEKLRQIAEAHIAVAGGKINARAECKDMYSAIDKLIDKLDRQLVKIKEKGSNHHS